TLARARADPDRDRPADRPRGLTRPAARCTPRGGPRRGPSPAWTAWSRPTMWLLPGRSVRRAVASGVLAILLVAALAGAAQGSVPPARATAQGDFAGLVDIGGRRLYLECQGTGSPTVVLEDGAGLGADVWSVDLAEPARPRPMVLPTVAGFTRVCAYD